MPLLLITRPSDPEGILERFCNTHEIQLLARSFIRFESVASSFPETMDALFFGSPRAVDFFLQQADIPAGCAIACIGPGTRKHLEELGLEVHFSGATAGDPEAVAKEIADWLGDRKLYIPASEQSNHSISAALPPDQSQEITVYRTLPDLFPLTGIPDFLVFTSPSNLESFLSVNTVDPRSKIIAWGKTTEKALLGQQIRVDSTLLISSERELTDQLKSWIS